MNSFQKQLKNDLKEIKKSSDLLVFADKTSNIYKMCTGDYNKLLKDNTTKTYKHAPPKLEKSINLEAKHIATNLKLDDRIERLARTPAYITLKDHKENFHVNTPCRLFNPCKSEIGKVSKQLLEKINNQLLEKLNVNQWRDTNKVIDWFVNLKDKQNSKFIQLDIKEFYPSITERTLDKAISFASEHTTITAESIRIIKHSRKSLLFHLDQSWKKKDSNSCFDVTMGSFDGAEICELIGIYMQSILAKIISKSDMGLYRDDGLIVLNNKNGQQTDRTRKKIVKIFKDTDFSIDITTNLVEVNFLDVTFNLLNETYRPYRKPNDELKYINVSSNHPPQIIKQLVNTINGRLSANSSSEKVFNESKSYYEDALNKSGYKTQLEYKAPPTSIKRNSKNRKRKIVWFNPPYNQSVSTNVAQTFLKLVDKHFPRSNRLYKIFNRNTIKVSYSCTDNIEQHVKKHNNYVQQKNKGNIQLSCNCRDKLKCPLNGKCRTENIVYKCTSLTESNLKKVYLGLAEGEFKTNRFYNHQQSFRNQKYSKSTTL